MKNSQQMKSIIEISPEWVLSEIPLVHLVDGNGNVAVHSVIAFDGSWIKLALETLNIEFKQLDWIKCEDSFFARFIFRIGDIREECPTLYEKLNAMDELIRNHENN